MNPCFSYSPQGFQFFQQVLEVEQGVLPPSHGTAAVAAATEALTYHVAVLREKVQQLEPLLGMVVSPAAHRLGQREAAAMAAHSASSVLQEITAAASAVAHRLSFNFNRGTAAASDEQQMLAVAQGADTLPFGGHEPVTLFGAAASTSAAANPAAAAAGSYYSVLPAAPSTSERTGAGEPGLAGGDADDVVELDASYLLARYTHYCQVCGKGFKRDANLRMHMRAHGDEYKTSAALSNPSSRAAGARAGERRRSYSCPAEGCRWNRRHPRFQPLKSVVCAKNHYRRSHCPKVYACRQCDGKRFAVLSDLRTHEKHCGELRWRCSCGTFFSRKDKLMGHVALFATGHAPILETGTATVTTAVMPIERS